MGWQQWTRCGPYSDPDGASLYFAIVLDGARFWVPGSGEPPDNNQFTVQGIQAIEIYRGPAETPIQYQATNSACGALLLWTRDGS